MNAYMKFAANPQIGNSYPRSDNVREQAEEVPEALSMVVDASGSMIEAMSGSVSRSMIQEDWRFTRLGAACEAGKALLEVKNTDYPHDRVAIITFGDSARVIHAPAWVGLNFESLTRALDGLEVEGSTNMEAGLRIAEAFVRGENVIPGKEAKGRSLFAKFFLADAEPFPSGLQQILHGVTHRVLLLTDGHNTGEDPVPVANRLKRSGAVIDCIGIGGTPRDVDEDLLRELASTGPDGRPRYAFIGDQAELVTKFKQLGHHLRLL